MYEGGRPGVFYTGVFTIREEWGDNKHVCQCCRVRYGWEIVKFGVYLKLNVGLSSRPSPPLTPQLPAPGTPNTLTTFSTPWAYKPSHKYFPLPHPQRVSRQVGLAVTHVQVFIPLAREKQHQSLGRLKRSYIYN